MHERTQIRNAVVSCLGGGGLGPTYPTAAGARVGPSRMPPQRGALLPAISVYVVDEVTDRVNGNSLRREATVAIDAWVSTVRPEDLDDALDDIALEIETAIDVDPSLGLEFVFRALQLESTELGVRLETDRPQGCAHLEFNVIYETDPRVGEPADEFLHVDATHGDPCS